MSELDPNAPLGRVAVFSPGIARIPHLKAFLGAEAIVHPPGPRARVDAVVGWGRKPNTARPRRWAEQRGVPFVALEDGFLRSVGLGVNGDPPLSIVVDPEGIYYDATRPSRLEAMLATDDTLGDPALLARARRCIASIRGARLSKYNDAPVLALGPETRPRVLVLDQTAGDQSVRLGLCPDDGFDAMLAAARAEHPHAEIVVKTHPDVASGKKGGYLTRLAARERLRLLTEPCNPAALLSEVDHVYVMTSLMGFEALMAEVPVTCFGAPFYAGWGLTDDRADVPARRGRRRSLEEVFAAAYLRYARYVDPEAGERCEAERIIEHLALQRAEGERNAPRMVCVGFSAWKRGFVPSFVQGPGVDVRFASGPKDAAEQLTEDAALLAWGVKGEEALEALAEEHEVPLWRMEDGFLRSVGLGSDLYAPASLVVDREGLYYDPRRPSELERILQEADFTAEELRRARALRERIVDAKISKYNVGVQRRVGPARPDGRPVVLVVGQVEDDASIQRGCLDVRRNAELLDAARAARPDAYLIYKPHPDVVSGNRRDSLPVEEAARRCDEVVVDAALADCLAVADEVHTMTSLVGFEALLRGIDVKVYGQPFYAGWGLTEDRHPHPRRTRTRDLDELVAAVLLRYPRYVHPETGRYTTPERIVEHLRSARPPAAWERTWAGRQVRKLNNLARVVARDRGARRARPAPLPSRPLPDLGVTHAVLLQGPAGPFMRRFADELEGAGVRATKVNFHVGDALFFPGPRAVSYRGTFDAFGGWLDTLMEDLGADGVFLFGDCRPLHRAAVEVAEARGAKVWVFEEGYLRPDWITLEQHGVNGHSRMPRDPAFYRALDLPKPPKARKVGQSFHLNSWYSTFNALAFTHLNGGYPHYRHHRILNAWYHTFVWCRNVVRKKRFEIAERDLLPHLTGERSGRYFFVPLQVHCDFQLVHSPYDDVWQFVREITAAFAEHADADDALVFKHHPMDRAYKEYGDDFRALTREHGLGDRLVYCHDLHLPTLLKHAKGTVTINSTVGLSSIHHRTPVKVLGTAVYDMEGLTHPGSLASFFRGEAAPPDTKLYERFRRYLLHTNQANGSFYKRVDERGGPTGIRWFPGPRR
ncbi:MAG TPA: hypothetical protein RMH99_04775 [Sandaracinaceae bacterium LLY-WYZ-13_1]|nr:hypothetical protein [Sandaracinaceae bacterium LLY-WYZ-13_1]